MTPAYIAADIMGIFVDAVILYANTFVSKQDSKKRRVFSMLVACNLFALLFDMLSWCVNRSESHMVLLYVSKVISFPLIYLSVFALMWYLYLHISERDRAERGPRGRKRVHRLGFKIVMGISAALCAVCLYAGLTGVLFSIDQGVYTYGTWYDLYIGSSILLLLGVLVVVLRYARLLGTHDSMAIVGYTAIPILSVIINVFWSDFLFMYPACTISMLIIFVVLQAEQERAYILNARTSSLETRRDELTGLQNRRAYNEACESIDDEGFVGVVFCDLNGLKYANDNFGHEHGDRRLCCLAELMIECFGPSKCYRISGDEFVVILPEVSQQGLEEMTGEFIRKATNNNDGKMEFPLASIGVAYGRQKDLERVIKAAERMMYEEKEVYHLRYPQLMRGKPQAKQGSTSAAAWDKQDEPLSRRAMEEMCEGLTGDENAVVVYCDVSGLNSSADAYDPASKDVRLSNMSDLLVECLTQSKRYRINDDEFVAVLPKVAQKDVRAVADEFVIRANSAEGENKHLPMASIGMAFGPQRRVEELIGSARRMVNDKEIYRIKYSELTEERAQSRTRRSEKNTYEKNTPVA